MRHTGPITDGLRIIPDLLQIGARPEAYFSGFEDAGAGAGAGARTPAQAAAIDRTQEALARLHVDLIHVARLMTLGELAASISHEVNQPLAAIVTNGEACLRWLAHDEPQVDQARASVAAMIKSALRSAAIIERLQLLCRKADVQVTDLVLNEAIREVIPLAEPKMLLSRVQLQLDLAADLPFVVGDRIQVQQVLLNLLVNGIQAMASVADRPRTLVVQSQLCDTRQVMVSVLDAGTGVDPHDPHLFDAFHTTKPEGMGMGLWICRSIVEAHGGKIWATRRTEHGAGFHFTLPSSF